MNAYRVTVRNQERLLGQALFIDLAQALDFIGDTMAATESQGKQYWSVEIEKEPVTTRMGPEPER